MLPSRGFFETPFPRATAAAWTWAALMILLLLGVPWTYARWSVDAPRYWIEISHVWSDAQAAAWICRGAMLLVVWLWVNHRTRIVLGRPDRSATLGLISAAVLAAAVSWTALAMIRASPIAHWTLTRVHP